MPRMIRNDVLDGEKAAKEMAPGKTVGTPMAAMATMAAKPAKKLTKKEQAKVDAKKASSALIAKFLSKEPTVKRAREYLAERVKELKDD